MYPVGLHMVQSIVAYALLPLQTALMHRLAFGGSSAEQPSSFNTFHRVQAADCRLCACTDHSVSGVRMLSGHPRKHRRCGNLPLQGACCSLCLCNCLEAGCMRSHQLMLLLEFARKESALQHKNPPMTLKHILLIMLLRQPLLRLTFNHCQLSHKQNT